MFIIIIRQNSSRSGTIKANVTLQKWQPRVRQRSAQDLSNWQNNTQVLYLRTECWIRYLNRTERKKQMTGENRTPMSFTVYTLHLILIVLLQRSFNWRILQRVRKSCNFK